MSAGASGGGSGGRADAANGGTGGTSGDVGGQTSAGGSGAANVDGGGQPLADGSSEAIVDAAIGAQDGSIGDAAIVDAGGGGVPNVSTFFSMDRPNVVRRSNIVLAKPNLLDTQYMPIGNGTLGVPVWAASGFTAQLNRSDSFPDRKSAGWVTIPGLSRLTGAADFSAYVDLYDGMLVETGGGMTLTAYVRADAQELVVDVTGADPSSTQTAQVQLWTGRSPVAQASGAIATLAETWQDNAGPDGSGSTFGVLSALTAGGRNVTASIVDPLTVRVSLQPNADGSFRVVVACPQWTGGNASMTAATLLGTDATARPEVLRAGHTSWWHDYWSRVDLIKMTSQDGNADYLENLRTVYLYTAAAGRGGPLPGSQAGVADLFAFGKDHHDWYPAGFWFWNLRMMMGANMTSGAFELNAPIFHLYQSNLSNMRAWTTAHMGGRVGICLPETMRFNGNGYYNGSLAGASCEQTITPTYNSLTVTSGAEVGLWVYQQYLITGDKAFLSTNYPLMSEAARFLLAYATMGSDGLLHTFANAHETQWAVQDPVTDIVAMRALFPAVVAAAQILGVDAALVTELQGAIPKIPPLPRTDAATHTQLLTASADAAGQDVIGISSQPTATLNNAENLDLEAVWPYGLIGDASPDAALAQRTYTRRRFIDSPDWSFDSLHAARLGLGSEVLRGLMSMTQKFQAFPSGMASWLSPPAAGSVEPYIEQAGVAVAAINEALAQHYDGLLRIAPAWPAAWNAAGTVHIQGGSKVNVVVEAGTVVMAVVEAGSTGVLKFRNPWSGQAATVVDGRTSQTVVTSDSSSSLTFPMTNGNWYVITRQGVPMASVQRAITATPATTAKRLGTQSIGL